jgi:DNA-binding NarL/FixJ family response regulator
MGSAIRLVVVDDHLTLAEALGARLDAEPDLAVVAAVGSAKQMWAVLEHADVDLVLLDLDLGDTDGLSVARELRDRVPPTRVVIIAAETEPSWVVQAVTYGVSGWVPKDMGLGQLLDTLRGVCRDETWIPAPLLTGVLDLLIRPQRDVDADAAQLARLTPREREVLQCMVDGMGRAEVAERLFLSQNTVRTHVQHLLAKLGLHSSLTAVALARRAGFDSSRDGMLRPVLPWRSPVGDLPAAPFGRSPRGPDRAITGRDR